MTSLSRPGQPAAARGFSHTGLALLGLALLLAYAGVKLIAF